MGADLGWMAVGAMIRYFVGISQGHHHVHGVGGHGYQGSRHGHNLNIRGDTGGCRGRGGGRGFNIIGDGGI